MRRFIGSIYYEKANDVGKVPKRNGDEEYVQAILQLADNSIDPIGILKVMHVLFTSHRESLMLVSRLVKEELLQWEQEDEKLFTITSKGRRWLKSTNYNNR